jgi:hypothetical protein
MPAAGGPFMLLKDAPFSHRTVAAVNLTRPEKGSWFHFPGPHMQTRKYFTAARRLLFRK